MIKKWWGDIIIPRNTPPYLEHLLEPSTENVGVELDEDIDVKTERNRVLSGSLGNAIIYLRNLRKVFSIMIHVSFFLHKCCFIDDTTTISCSIMRIFLISGISRRKASWAKSCCRFLNLFSSGRRMFWLFGDKWGWKDHNFVHAMRYIRFLNKIFDSV